MEGVILTLCLSLALVLIGVVLCGGIRLRENYRKLMAEMNDGKCAPRTILVKQNAGELRLVYSIQPQVKLFERDLARELAVIRAAQESDIFLRDDDLPASQPPCSFESPQTVAEENFEEPTMEEGSSSEDVIMKEGIPMEDGSSEERSAEGAVLIHRGEKLDFSKRYELLSENERALFDGFCRYVEKIPFCERRMQANCLVFRYKKETIVKVGIRRGTAVLEFHILNPDLGRMLREERLKGMKVQPAKIKLTSETELALAQKTADLTVNFLKNEETYKRDQRNAARREAERRKRAEGGRLQ